MFTITKEFHFSASHVLNGLPEGHQCGRVHGHNIVVRVELAAADLDETGMVLDYGQLAPLGKMIDELLDHRHLNDVVDFNPTAENFCRWIYQWCVTQFGWPVSRVGWSETPKTWAYYQANTGIGKADAPVTSSTGAGVTLTVNAVNPMAEAETTIERVMRQSRLLQ